MSIIDLLIIIAALVVLYALWLWFDTKRIKNAAKPPAEPPQVDNVFDPEDAVRPRKRKFDPVRKREDDTPLPPL